MPPRRGKPKTLGAGDPAGKTTPATAATPAKKFTKSRKASNRGRKILLYAASGMGKTTLAVLAPKPILIPLDDGSADIKHPVTNELIEQVEDVRTFGDTRAALQQYGLYDDNETVIIDTVTKLEDLSHAYMCATIPHEKGHTCTSIEGYGYGKGYRHLYDTMKLILQDADELVRRGKNVILIAQCVPRSIPNAGGEDYLCFCPRLYPGSKNLPSIELLYSEWADDVLFIAHANAKVVDHKIEGAATRAIYTFGELHFKAKTRVLASGETIPQVISFEDTADDSLWQYLFEGASDGSDIEPPPE